jgi:hypothetical protein
MKVKQKQDEVENALEVFYPKCKDKHPCKECPLDSVEVCGICELDHPTKIYQLFPRLKVVF